ncbi:hypothetical protein SCLCIDRAFT_12154 [Scleroderma citrinum Foug A]|uniref:Ras-associating domain-containing protein n=1 Tax=Scleroderma citrinum Foug A TaxID=1036808 RepID=A0A0C3D5F6_9AGAM|nr:hypothetical protein SCLCIDRAFT_12154 [Scleroderma citrinum Foug A]
MPNALQSGTGTGADRQQAQEIRTAQQHQQQHEQQLLAQQQQPSLLRHQSSKDCLTANTGGPPSPSSPSKTVDPAEVTEIKKLTVTLSIVREEQVGQGPLLPSAIIMQQQEEERKRTREELEALKEAAKKKLKGKDKASATAAPVSKAHTGRKLRKEQRDTTDDEAKEKREKKKGGMFSLFGRRKGKDKDKDKDKDKASIESASSDMLRELQESGRFSGPQNSEQVVPTSSTPQQHVRASSDASKTPSWQQTPQPSPQQLLAQVSQHASQLRQPDQQHQAMSQQYLNRSPSSPPEVPSYGLQSVAVVLNNSNLYASPVALTAGLGLGLPLSCPHPGSLVLSPTADGQGVGVPELSIIRIFAGKHVQTEATFKTILLNTSTTSTDLMRQAIQRFRLSSGERGHALYCVKFFWRVTVSPL